MEEIDYQSFSKDYILGGKIVLIQPLKGYRVAIDPIFLAAAIEANPQDKILEIGVGVGAASLSLAFRLPDVRIVGIDLQRDYVRIASLNVRNNNMQKNIEALHGNLLTPPPRLAAGTFSHVMANPPYFDEASANASPSRGKSLSNASFSESLFEWARFALLMVRPKGSVTFIYHAHKLDKILSYLYGKLGYISVYPLWPKKNREAKRVLIKGFKNLQGPLSLKAGMVLHKEDGSYTEEAEAVLRGNAPIVI